MEKSSFFNSVAGDRKYQAADFASYFNSFITNGVFPNPSTNLQVISNNNMTITIKVGAAWINGYFYKNDSDLILPIDVADGVLNRVDRLVIQYNTINRNITAKVKKGVFASTPVALLLQRDSDAFELGIADIYIGAGVVSIVGANITDLRLDTTKCGIVNSLIQADTTSLFNQYQAWFTAKQTEFNSSLVDYTTTNQATLDGLEAQFSIDWNAWFTTIQGALNGDIAGNLLTLINDNVQHPPYVVTTGIANAYIVTLNPIPISYVDGMGLCAKINISNTGASTINVNGLGIKSIKDSSGNTLTGNKLVVNGQYDLRYESVSGCFKMQGSSSLPVNVFVQLTDPGASAIDNDIWFDLTNNLIKRKLTGAWKIFDSVFSS